MAGTVNTTSDDIAPPLHMNTVMRDGEKNRQRDGIKTFLGAAWMDYAKSEQS